MIIAKIETGGNGTVSKYQLDGKIVAMKEIKSPFCGINDSAVKEIHSYYILKNCSNIVQLIDIELINSNVRLIMPYYPHDLSQYVNKSLFIERIQYLEPITSQLLDILSHLYQNNIVHGDIKPKNILVNEEMKIYLADFGAARFNCQIYHGGLGTEIYEAPELQNFTSIYVNKVDIWATGITIVEYLTGRHVFENESYAIDVKKILVSQLDIDKFMLIPNAIINLLDKMLLPNPVERVSITDLIPGLISKSFTKNVVKNNFSEYITEVGKQFKLQDITITTAIELYNKYDNGKDTILTIYGCIAIASKMNEIHSPEFSDYVFVSDSSFTVEQLKNMEVKLLKLIYDL